MVSEVSPESDVDRYVLEKSKENNAELTRLKWLNRTTLVLRATRESCTHDFTLKSNGLCLGKGLEISVKDSSLGAGELSKQDSIGKCTH